MMIQIPSRLAEENNVFQICYKQSTRCKTHRTHGHGYLSKTPSRSELLKAQIQEQARAREAANHKNNTLQQKVDKLEEQLANEKAERERILEEKLLQIQEEENNKRQALREDIMKEMLSKFAEQRETPLLQHIGMCFVPKLLPPVFPMQTDPRSIIPSDATPTIEKNASKHRTSTVSRDLVHAHAG
uniref:Uncharacterized protein n=1 Tax=Setaria viridis TaxID=4556 RepID=A0A4V6DA34_SETVI|nr:hypothetical protein SEVIR_3G300500v2 [Setaria viridis]